MNILNSSIWGDLSNLSREDQEQLKNHDNLPAGAVAKIIRKIFPMFGIEDEGRKKFRISIEKDITVIKTERTDTIIKADNEANARRIMLGKLNDDKFLDELEFKDWYEDEDDCNIYIKSIKEIA